MQFTAQELKDKLLRALDADSNVVDHQAVLEVISTLEKYPVTKTQLEQTRLGKHVNDLRRKTTNKDLAKRAKKLVRKWHDFIGPNNAAHNTAVNGERVAGASGAKTDLNSMPPHVLKGVLGSKPGSPASGPPTPSSGKSNLSPASLQYTASTPGSSRPETPVASSVHTRLSPRLSSHPKPASPLISASPTVGPNSKKHSPGLDVRLDKSNSGTATSCEENRPSTPSEGVSKLNVANKRKRRGPVLEEASFKISKYPMPSDNADGSHKSNNNGESYKNSQVVVNGYVPGYHSSRSGVSRTSHVSDRGLEPAGRQVSPSNRAGSLGADSNCATQSLKERRNASFSMRTDLVSRLDSMPSSTVSPHGHLERSLSSCSSPIVKTPKVKTTVQLIQELHNNAGMRLSGSETVTRIAMNQIEKEPDVSESIVPPEAKPRFRRKPGTSAFVAPPPSTDKSLSKTKTEMVQKFLMSSMPEGLPTGEPPTTKDDSLINLIKQDDERVASLVKSQPVSDRSRTASPEDLRDVSQAAAVQDEVDPWSLLPPLDPDSVDLSDDHYTISPPLDVGVAEVDRLDSEHWPGINGQLDHECNWQPWTNTFSMPSANDNLLHILPYVCLDND